MFGIGFFELVLIAVAVLIFVGPQKLPEVMRQAGKLFVQVRRTANDVRGTFDQVIRDAEDELRKEEQAALKELLAVKAAAAGTVVTTTATAITDAPAGTQPLALSPHQAKELDPMHPDVRHANDHLQAPSPQLGQVIDAQTATPVVPPQPAVVTDNAAPANPAPDAAPMPAPAREPT